MLMFCPQCGNMLALEEDPGQRFACRTCPYIYPITKKLATRSYMKKKEVDDVMSKEKGWENVPAIDMTCPKCENPRAFFQQIQIRSADEPMSLFFKCCNCDHTWMEK
ncbi:transcription factor S [Allomyces macrogynus ATCC 38327]|uniref:DNA-directed RNA polymerase subunit n=1 Tax=Allomyces macrogynus (strain ATCC 38327) TaxID=578462 RepID=A0A0L0T130_ALLM3|nr:transcription factor S [Allomyces macrogynus ATCC 38327]|eukprot:KNE68365.1 transcription factor S [Allomyces macrogynus ATCC 38327]